MSIRMVLVDDHDLLRQGLAALLSANGDFDVVGDAPDAEHGISMVREMRPDVVLMDISLPGTSGISATRSIMRERADTKVLMLSMHAREEMVVESLLAGATSYALKSDPADRLFEAIRRTADGKLYLAPGVPRTALDEYHRRIRGLDGGPVGTLSAREREVFELIIRNRTNRQISEALGITVKTVETHRAHINRKLKVHSTAELVRFAALNGLLSE